MPIPTPLKVAFIPPVITENYPSGMTGSLDEYLKSPLSIRYLNGLKFRISDYKQADFLVNKDILEELYAEYDVIAGFIKPAAIEAIIHFPPDSKKHRCRFILMHSPERWIELY